MKHILYTLKGNYLTVKEIFFSYLKSVTSFMSARDAAMEGGKTLTEKVHGEEQGECIWICVV